ncbi:SDR family NAD(P)-dependent oxidoreductase [Antrihabitans stalactiti]|uniref:SDR family NAD(P)-dependent oxidoreductase n=1 Tax=Antrihabitans stalactiti TaxID=2584121 RepID=A0A848KC91_9NOCA|nr:SDR family NAD(P)-dependent oxidoreductase [Antrihabitans stalactiti]NMN93740.1 SDR family NAD(P)-dependent oxidoreductase [Antrihabitans stalactiti]
MNLANRLLDRVVNPPRLSDPDALRRAVSGKTVLVTGASFGLGESTARKLGAAGATVLLVARTASKLDDVAASINAAGGHAMTYAADLTDEVAVAELAKLITEEHGALDIIVNNAGKSIRRSLELQYDRPQDFQRTIDINYLGPIRLLLALIPPMRDNGGGHIINVSTVGVRIAPGPRWGAYQASKGAFDTWLRSVSPELRTDGIAVSSLYMALIYTRMSAPTPIMRKLPGLHPDDAADIVVKAIVERPRDVEPWWVWPAEVGSAVARGPLEVAMRLMYQFSTDTASATGAGR